MKKKHACILLVDDHPIIRQGLKATIEAVGRYTVTGEASGANEALDLIVKEQPDLAIVDIQLEGTVNGIDFVQALRTRFPAIKTLILSMHHESIYAERAIKAGANGYLMKDTALVSVTTAIDTVMNGDLYVSEQFSKKIIESLIRQSGNTDRLETGSLSNRELEIFQRIGNGESSLEIAHSLNLSVFTVESHKKNIKKKMNLDSSSDLTKHAIQWVITNKA